MKVIITEAQLNKIMSSYELKFRRNYDEIKNNFLNNLEAYIPCNYNYEDGVYDYFADIRSHVAERYIAKYFGLYLDSGPEFLDAFDVLSDMLFDSHFDYTKSFYDAWIQKYCPDKKF